MPVALFFRQRAGHILYAITLHRATLTKQLTKIMNMKTVSTIFSAAALSLFAFTASAHSVTATSNTLDSAEAMIAKKAKELNATDYKITSAHMGNKVTMSAVLDK